MTNFYTKLISLAAALLLFTLSSYLHGSLAESSLDNGVIKVGINTTNYGGAITYLSESGSDYNLINNHDQGRQVQQSYYAGQLIDRRSEGQRSSWSPWPWNPIQVGDTYFNASPVLDYYNDGSEIYVKTQPLLWDMDNELAECHMETWIQLEDNRVRVRNRLTTFRTDDLWEEVARHQELPAVYTIADLPHLYTYEGSSPFMDAPLKKIVNNGMPSGPPWVYWGQELSTENWAAFVNSENWGVGVYYGDTQLFVGGFHGTPNGGPWDGSTGYISPLRTMILKKDTVFEYEYILFVGTLESIRTQVYALEGRTVWTGMAENHRLDSAANWRIGQEPLSGDRLLWSGFETGELSLVYPDGFGGEVGFGLVLGSQQIGTVTIRAEDSTGGSLRLRNGVNEVAFGSGGLTIGGGPEASHTIVELVSDVVGQNFFFNNYSETPLVFSDSTTLRRSPESSGVNLMFRGGGQVHLAGAIESLGSGRFQVREGIVRLEGVFNHSGNIDAESGVLEFVREEAIGATGNRIKLGQASLEGRLRYTGSEEATLLRRVMLGNGPNMSHFGAGTIEANGAGSLIFANNVFNANASQNSGVTRILTLDGNSYANNEIRGTIRNNATGSGPVGIVKKGGGLWILSGDNTYSGDTVVLEGSLLINGNQSEVSAPVTVHDGAALGGSGTHGGDLILHEGAGWVFQSGPPLTVSGTVIGGFSVSDVLEFDEQVPDGRYPLIQGNVDPAMFYPLSESDAHSIGEGVWAWFEAGDNGIDLRIASAARFDTWKQQHGLTGADAHWDSNPSGDGISNLLKYAFNLDPLQNEGSGRFPEEYRGLPYITTSSDYIEETAYLKMIYYRDTSKPDIVLTPLWNRFLDGTTPWREVENRELVDSSGSVEKLRARIPVENARGFIKLRVDLIED